MVVLRPIGKSQVQSVVVNYVGEIGDSGWESYDEKSSPETPRYARDPHTHDCYGTGTEAASIRVSPTVQLKTIARTTYQVQRIRRTSGQGSGSHLERWGKVRIYWVQNTAHSAAF